MSQSFNDFLAEHNAEAKDSLAEFMAVLTVRGQSVEWVRVSNAFEFFAVIDGHELRVYGDRYRHKGVSYGIRGTNITLEESPMGMTEYHLDTVSDKELIYAVERECKYCGAPGGVYQISKEQAETDFAGVRSHPEFSNHTESEARGLKPDVVFMKYHCCSGCRGYDS